MFLYTTYYMDFFYENIRLFRKTWYILLICQEYTCTLRVLFLAESRNCFWILIGIAVEKEFFHVTFHFENFPFRNRSPRCFKTKHPYSVSKSALVKLADPCTYESSWWTAVIVIKPEYSITYLIVQKYNNILHAFIYTSFQKCLCKHS